MLLARCSRARGRDRGHEDRHRQRGRAPAGDPRLAAVPCASTAWTRTTWSSTTPRRADRPLRRPARLEPHRHRPALSAAGHQLSQPQGGHRLAPRPRGLPGQLPLGRCRRAARRAEPPPRHSAAIPHGSRATVRRRAGLVGDVTGSPLPRPLRTRHRLRQRR